MALHASPNFIGVVGHLRIVAASLKVLTIDNKNKPMDILTNL